MARIAVLVAMESELVHLRSHAEDELERTDLAGRDCWLMRIGVHEVYAVRSRIGMLNAASTAERTIAELQPDVILNFGCAGAYSCEVMPGDVIIGSETVNIGSYNVLTDGTEAHNGRGYDVSTDRIFPAIIDADPDLLAFAKDVAESHTIVDWPSTGPWPAAIARRSPRFHIGPVASSEVWTQQLSRIDTLHARHGSLSEDMESSAFAHVAHLHGVPFLAIKDISNNELHGASDLQDFSDFPTDEVGKRAAAFTAAVIAALS